jgi:uncharacterized protein with gpF-like domain
MASNALSRSNASLSNARLPFAEQIAAVRERLRKLIPTERWDDIMHAAHDRAFMVAGAKKADLLADLADAVDTAIADGKTIQWFRQQFYDIVERTGWAYRGERAWRTRIIYQTNVRSSYAAGRLAQLRDPALLEVAPIWVYRHGGSADPRPQHLAWDGLALPADDPWWVRYYPPNGWGCSCYVVAVSREQAQRMGLTVADSGPTVSPDAVPPEWAYQPGATVADELRRKADALPGTLGDGLLQDLEGRG